MDFEKFKEPQRDRHLKKCINARFSNEGFQMLELLKTKWRIPRNVCAETCVRLQFRIEFGTIKKEKENNNI